MLITVAICTYNRATLLKSTIESLLALRVPPGVALEILVVDNNSTDDTARVVDDYCARGQVRGIFEEQQGLSNARNRALKDARGEAVAFVDDDVLVDPGWCEALCEGLREFRDAAAFGGTIDPWFVVEPDPDMAAAFPEVAKGFCALDHGRESRLLDAGEYVWGANMAFRRSRLAGLQFDPAMGLLGEATRGNGEEMVFLDALRSSGGGLCWLPEMRVRHYVIPERMEMSYLREFVQGQGRLEWRRSALADATHPRLFGAPRWLWGRMVRLRVRAMMLRSMGYRREGLRAYRHALVLMGMIQAAQGRVD